MSDTVAALIVAALIGISLAGAYIQIRRALGHESTKDRLIREARERAQDAALQDGITLADAARRDWLGQDVEHHLMQFLIDNPDVADGFARLHQAAIDEQRKGEL